MQHIHATRTHTLTRIRTRILCVSVCVQVCMCVYTHLCMLICTCTCMHVPMYMFVCVYVRACIYAVYICRCCVLFACSPAHRVYDAAFNRVRTGAHICGYGWATSWSTGPNPGRKETRGKGLTQILFVRRHTSVKVVSKKQMPRIIIRCCVCMYVCVGVWVCVRANVHTSTHTH